MWRFRRRAETGPVLTLEPPPIDDPYVVVLDLPAPAAATVTRCQAIAHQLKVLPDGERLRVVGESDHQDALRRAGFDVTVALVPEENNRWDHNAVRVDVIDAQTATTVGYLAAADAEQYQPELLALRDAGYVGVCPAVVTGRGFHGIDLHVCSARDLRAVVSEESGGVSRERDGKAYLRADWPCAVTHEDQGALSEYTPRQGARQRRVQASLAVRDHVIEVRLGGFRVGQLPDAMSLRYGDLVDRVVGRGLEPTCVAHVRTTDDGLRVELELPALR